MDYSGLLSDPELGRASRKRIAFVSSDIMGPIRNGGVGTAVSTLAHHLASDGHEVTLLFVNPGAPGDENFHEWQRLYLRLGIHLQTLPEPSVSPEGLRPAQFAYAVYDHLRQQSFDIIHFADMHGLGHFALTAKRQGLAFADTLLCVTLHGPTIWHVTHNDGLTATLEELQFLHLERMSVENADVLFAPTRYALDWARSNGWKLPRRTFVEQHLIPPAANLVYSGRRNQVDEIVFFGRVETRKGVEIFCDALRLLPHSLLRGRKITLLGKMGFVQSRPAHDYLTTLPHLKRLRLQRIEHLQQPQALEYLRTRNALVVLPSRAETMGYTLVECLQCRIPFIAARIPAYEEIVHPDDHERALFELNAEALATRLRAALEGRVGRAPRFAIPPARTARAWRTWHRRVRTRAGVLPPASKRPEPKVSICVAHRDRPELLADCLASLRAQNYRNFEVIVVDDDSRRPVTLKYLEELERELPSLGWKLLRQPACRGPGAARNRAAREAKGEWLMFSDDDNLARPEEVAKFVEVAQNTGADVLTCAFDRFEGLGTPEESSRPLTRWVPTGEDLGIGLFFNTFGDMNCFIKRKVYERLGGLPELTRVANEDWALLARAAIRGYRLQAIPDPLFWYREHPTSLSKKAPVARSVNLVIDAFAEALPRPEFRAFLGFCNAMRYVRFPTGGADPHEPLFNPKRSNLFGGHGSYRHLLYLANETGEFKPLQRAVGLKIKKEAPYLRLSQRGPKCSFQLPTLRAPRRGPVLVRLDLFALDTGRIEIKAGAAAVEQPIRTGHNLLEFLVPPPKTRFKVTVNLDLGRANCLLRQIEVLADGSPRPAP